LIPLGVGDAFSETRYGCCLAVEADNHLILVDCPHPVRKMMREASQKSGVEITAERVEAVILTHLHADHASGLESLAYYSFFVLKKRLVLYTHPEVAARLWEGHLAAGMEQLLPAADAAPIPMSLEQYFEVRFLDENAPVLCGPFLLHCHRTIHHIPTFAVKIQHNEGILGISADTCFDPELLSWLEEAALIIHETNFGVHTPYEKLAELPEALREKMRLTHYFDGFDCKGSVIRCLEEGKIEEIKAGMR
jgi:ribonuclease BN (tRNA processing enzyme)